MASYDGATLKVTELFSTGHSTANVWRLHGCVLDFIHLSATGVAEIAEYTNLMEGPHTFGHVVYIQSIYYQYLSITSCPLPPVLHLLPCPAFEEL